MFLCLATQNVLAVQRHRVEDTDNAMMVSTEMVLVSARYDSLVLALSSLTTANGITNSLLSVVMITKKSCG